MAWNFQDIQRVCRQVSGQLSSSQLTNSELNFYINNYYQLDLPRELKIEEMYRQYTFPTQVGVQSYVLPDDYTHIEPSVYVNGVPINYTQDTNQFYDLIPVNWVTEQVTSANGVAVAFASPPTLTQLPIASGIPNSVLVTAGNITLSDDGLGNLNTDPVTANTGTVNYTTGAWTLNFAVAPASGTAIIFTYNFLDINRPNTCLFYDRTFTFYPCPNAAYNIRVDAFIQPTPLVNPTDVPLKPEWGDIIAIGGALKILRDFGQLDKYQEVKIYYEKERSKLLSDTDNQYMAMRGQPRW